jgi:Beta-propeller repeat
MSGWSISATRPDGSKAWISPRVRKSERHRMLLILLILSVCATASAADGVQVVFSSTLGFDDCDDIASDAQGNLYLACHSTRAPNDAVSPGGMDAYMDAYVCKLNPKTSRLDYITRLSGDGWDGASRVKIDGRGHAYAVGFTKSKNFPTTANAIQPAYAGGDSDAFLVEIGPAGEILYSTFIGGSGADQGNGLWLAPNGEVYIAGTTWSSDFPGAAANRQLGPGGNGDVFLASLSPGRAHERRAVVFGGSAEEKLTGLIADRGGSVFLAGYTLSADFPTHRPLQADLKGRGDAFIAKLQPGWQAFGFSTFFGGNGNDSAWGITINPDGNPVVAGISESTDLPTTSRASQRRLSGSADAFLIMLDSSGGNLMFSTYYGGSGTDHSGYDGGNIAVDSRGRTWLVGSTDSRDLPVPGAHQPAFGGGNLDGFVAAFSPAGRLCYGTYRGGNDRDLLEGVSFSSASTLYATGAALPLQWSVGPARVEGDRFGTIILGLRFDRFNCR